MPNLDGCMQITGVVASVDPDALRLFLLPFAHRVVQPFVPAADLDFVAAVNVENVGLFCFSCHGVTTPLIISDD